MRQRGDGARLPLEPGERVGIRREAVGDHLDGDFATEARVSRPVNFSHAPGADRRQNLVGAKPRPGAESHGRHGRPARGGATLPLIGRVEATLASETKVSVIGPTPMMVPSCTSVGEVMPCPSTLVRLRLFSTPSITRSTVIEIRACRRDTDG